MTTDDGAGCRTVAVMMVMQCLVIGAAVGVSLCLCCTDLCWCYEWGGGVALADGSAARVLHLATRAAVTKSRATHDDPERRKQ